MRTRKPPTSSAPESLQSASASRAHAHAAPRQLKDLRTTGKQVRGSERSSSGAVQYSSRINDQWRASASHGPKWDRPMSKSSITTRLIATPNRVTAHPGEVLNEEFLKPLRMSVNALAMALMTPRRRERSCFTSYIASSSYFLTIRRWASRPRSRHTRTRHPQDALYCALSTAKERHSDFACLSRRAPLAADLIIARAARRVSGIRLEWKPQRSMTCAADGPATSRFRRQVGLKVQGGADRQTLAY